MEPPRLGLITADTHDLAPDLAHHLALDDFAAFFTALAARFHWSPRQRAGEGGWDDERAIVLGAAGLDGALITGLSLPEVESFFRLRLLQLAEKAGTLDLPILVFPRVHGASPLMTPGFGRRMASAWPFRSVLFVADTATVAALRRESLPAITIDAAKALSLPDLLSRCRETGALADRAEAIAVQVQPMWGRCGSSTPFANQIDALLDQGFFTIRVFIDGAASAGPTLRRRLDRLLAQNTLDAAPHIEALASPPGEYLSRLSSQADVAFADLVRSRTAAAIHDPIVAGLVARAGVAMVNHAINVGFALKACPTARLVVETHDYLARAAFERARRTGDRAAFPTFGALKRFVALENRLWRAADVCTTVSAEELRTVGRQAPGSVFVLPKPYARIARPPEPDAAWDLLIVADQHPFNVESVDWFLEQVVAESAEMAAMRIAIVGTVRNELEARWRGRLPQVHWLGFVADLDDLRDQTRLSVCPDLAGTGVAIKTLTAFAARHPFVATRVALRGLPKGVRDIMPFTQSAQAMRAEIVALLADESLLAARREVVSRVAETLIGENSYAAALGASAGEGGLDRARARRAILSDLDARQADAAWVVSGDPIQFDLGVGGNAGGILGDGWHFVAVCGHNWQWEEPAGRWMDGERASLRLAAALLSPGSCLEISFAPPAAAREVTLRIGDRMTTAILAPEGPHSIVWRPDLACASDGLVTLEIAVAPPGDAEGETAALDDRVLGLRVETVRIQRSEPAPLAVHEPRRRGIGPFLSRIISRPRRVGARAGGDPAPLAASVPPVQSEQATPSARVSIPVITSKRVRSGLFCKSFAPDLQRFKLLVRSIMENNRSDLPLFVCVPRSDLPLFRDAVPGSATLIAEEDFMDPACFDWLDGWRQQQIAKLSFYRTGLYDRYLVLDSDSYFIRPFSEQDLFGDPEEIRLVASFDDYAFLNGSDDVRRRAMGVLEKSLYSTISARFDDAPLNVPRCFLKDLNYKNCPADLAAAVIPFAFSKHGSIPKINFMPPPMLFSSEIMAAFERYITAEDLTFTDLIHLSPWEADWYGHFALKFYADRIRTVEPLFFHFTKDEHLAAARAMGMSRQTLATNFFGLNLAARHQSEWML